MYVGKYLYKEYLKVQIQVNTLSLPNLTLNPIGFVNNVALRLCVCEVYTRDIAAYYCTINNVRTVATCSWFEVSTYFIVLSMVSDKSHK